MTWSDGWMVNNGYIDIIIISIPDEELFSETVVGCTASYFV